MIDEAMKFRGLKHAGIGIKKCQSYLANKYLISFAHCLLYLTPGYGLLKLYLGDINFCQVLSTVGLTKALK